MRSLSFNQLFVALFAAFALFLAASALQAWTGPTATPPNGNASAPINVGTSDQIKNGGLGVNTLAVYGTQYIQTKLGIGRELPVVPLDVNGTIRIANSGEVCQSVTAGAVRFNSGTAKLEYCNGTDWIGVSGSVTTVTAGSQTYSTAGTYIFNVPNYNSMTVTVIGAGGGGGSAYFYDGGGQSGTAGGGSSFMSSTPVSGTGGGAGVGGGSPSPTPHVTNGTAGTASGGDTNTTGGGAAGGTGSSFNDSGYVSQGGTGGAGGKAIKTWAAATSGAPTPATAIQVVVGAAGNGGAEGGGNGTKGSVTVSWN